MSPACVQRAKTSVHAGVRLPHSTFVLDRPYLGLGGIRLTVFDVSELGPGARPNES